MGLGAVPRHVPRLRAYRLRRGPCPSTPRGSALPPGSVALMQGAIRADDGAIVNDFLEEIHPVEAEFFAFGEDEKLAGLVGVEVVV